MSAVERTPSPDLLPSYRQLMSRTDAPPGSTWGLFGSGVSGDMGTLALLGPEQVLRGRASIEAGERYSLNYPINAFDPPMLPTRPSPTLTLTSRHPEHLDDVLDGFNPQSSSQIDGLRHRRHERHGFYNWAPDEEISPSTARLGVQQWAARGIAGRGLLVDVQADLAPSAAAAWHSTGPAIVVDDLQAALRRQGDTVQAGDILLLHTGWAHWYLDELDAQGRQECRKVGRYTGLEQSRAMIEWIWDHRVSLIGSDTYALEVLPPVADSEFNSTHDGHMMHQELLALVGLGIGELWKLDSLAAACRVDRRYTSMLVSSPLHVIGGVSTPANAVALR